MSQKKVDEYKKYKANRKEILAQQKRRKDIKTGILTTCAVVVIGAFVYWGYYSYEDAHKGDIAFTNLINQDAGGFYSANLDGE